MLKEETISRFDTSKLHVGDVVKYTRLGSGKQPRLALVQTVSPEVLTVIYCHRQTGKVSYQRITAKDVAVGIYTLSWTADLLHVQGADPSAENAEDDLPDLEEEIPEEEEEEEDNVLEDVDFSVSVED